MRSFVVTLTVSALWAILGALLDGSRWHGANGGAAGGAWWWDTFHRHAWLARPAALPASHPLARLTRSA